jgi:PadR family transcriptional regulator
MTPRNLGMATLAVLQAIDGGLEYGFEIADATGLATGTVYPALSSLERRGLVSARWEGDAKARAEARPRRKYYRLTAAGRSSLRESLARLETMGLTGVVRPGRLRGAEGR